MSGQRDEHGAGDVIGDHVRDAGTAQTTEVAVETTADIAAAPASGPRPLERRLLAGALAALGVVFALWYRDATQPLLAVLFFAGPPLLLCLGVLLRRRTAPFWAGVLGLFWFSHGVMLAWSEPAQRGYALAEVALALVAIFAANAPGLRARFGRRANKPSG
jgi:uncharacterized membrane protein